MQHPSQYQQYWAEDPQLSTSKSKRSRHLDLLDSDTTCRPVRRKPVITPVMTPIPRPLPTRDPDTFLRFLRNLLSSSSRTDAVRTDGPHNPLDVCFLCLSTSHLTRRFPATSPLPRPLSKQDKSSLSTLAPTTQSSAINNSPALKSSLHQLSTWWPF